VAVNVVTAVTTAATAAPASASPQGFSTPAATRLWSRYHAGSALPI